MTIEYEWDIEQVALHAQSGLGAGDVVDHDFADKLSEYPPQVLADALDPALPEYRLVLVRRSHGDPVAWAYHSAETGALGTFKDAVGATAEVSGVLHRFKRELADAICNSQQAIAEAKHNPAPAPAKAEGVVLYAVDVNVCLDAGPEVVTYYVSAVTGASAQLRAMALAKGEHGKKLRYIAYNVRRLYAEPAKNPGDLHTHALSIYGTDWVYWYSAGEKAWVARAEGQDLRLSHGSRDALEILMGRLSA